MFGACGRGYGGEYVEPVREPVREHGGGMGFAFILVLFILLIIVLAVVV
jgi:uncharacterized protein (TIGR01732 family)